MIRPLRSVLAVKKLRRPKSVSPSLLDRIADGLLIIAIVAIVGFVLLFVAPILFYIFSAPAE
jgi:hypothetical protein